MCVCVCVCVCVCDTNMVTTSKHTMLVYTCIILCKIKTSHFENTQCDTHLFPNEMSKFSILMSYTAPPRASVRAACLLAAWLVVGPLRDTLGNKQCGKGRTT